MQNGLAQGLGTLFEKNRISSRGVFQKGKLDGIGRIETINGDIYDGIFIKGDLFVGVYYNNEKKEFFFSQFEENKPKKIYCSGNGFPFEILGIRNYSNFFI